MEDLFRLTLIRPAVAQDPDQQSIDLEQESAYQVALRAAIRDGKGRTDLEEVSVAYVAGQDFLGAPDAHPQQRQLADLDVRLEALGAANTIKPQDLVDAVRATFNGTPSEVVARAEFKQARTKLRDSLLAIKLLQQEHTRPIERLTGQLRTMEVIARAAADTKFPNKPAQLRRSRRRSLRLPMDLGLRSRLSTREAEAEQRRRRDEAAAARRQRVDELMATHELLREAIAELATVPSKHFRVAEQVASDAVDPPAALDLIGAMTGFGQYTSRVRDLNIRQLERTTNGGGVDATATKPIATATKPPETGSPGAPSLAAEEPPATTPDGEPIATLAAALVNTGPSILTGRQAFSVPDLTQVGFVLHPSANQVTSTRTQQALTERGLELTNAPLDLITQRLERDLAGTVGELEKVAGHPVKQSLRFLGDTVVTLQTPLTKGWGELGTGGFVNLPDFPLTGSVPQTKGVVAPAGVADLLLVRQQLTGYETADVAHIENVLRGEGKQREHTRREETEVLTLQETEVSTAEEHELETADRFEMTRETSQTLKEEIALKAGLQVSGKYGPTVEFSASAEGSFSRTKEEATKAAATFSQDITERTSRKIAERTLTRTTTRKTTEITDKNTHELNNVNGNRNISGVYQWVSKVYQAQMFNYGLRVMFDFMVPEPAAFLIGAMRQAHNQATTLTKPADFTLTPAQLNPSNYNYWVQVTGATGVAPPPELYRTKSADFKAGGGDEKTNYNHAGQITIDDGYRAVYGSVGTVRNMWKSDHTVDVVLGRRTHRMPDGDWLWTTTLDDEQDSIPFAIDTFHCSQVAVVIEVKTQRTDRALDKWRLETHAKLTEAHQRQVADYEEKLANLQLQAGVTIRGRNPATNQELIKAELKKNCVSILTDQHFDLFDAINTSPSNGLPQPDISEAAVEGAYIRFFEHAFEWEHMSWVTYPYFWGRKDQWDEALGYADPDPLFEEFLKAGYCRVTVPARLSFVGTIDHFLTFGEIWNGGPLPPISSPLYLPIADEIAEQLDRPGTEVPQGDPWTVRVPTSLVKLRADDQLPRWRQNQNGEWVEDEDEDED